MLVVRLSGKLHAEDYQRFLPEVEQAVRQYGKIRVLVEMHDFHGWTPGGLWEDIKFDAKHFNHIDRLALVGEKKWEQWMATFCRPFTTARIRYFPLEHAADAHNWLTQAEPAATK